MKQYIVLLRGINVGGQKKVPMADLRQILTEANFEEVRTYIQSGNVILKTNLNDSKSVSAKVAHVIKNHFRFEVEVLSKTREELEEIFNNCPFPQEQKEKSYFMMLFEAPNKELVLDVSKISFPNEAFIIKSECIYMYSGIGYGKSKLNNNFFERKLKISATARNYNTMQKLLSLSAD